MPTEAVVVLVEGGPESRAYAVARTTALALEAAGAAVELTAPPSAIGREPVQGVRVQVRVEEPGCGPARRRLKPGPAQGEPSLAQAARIGGGVVLMLMLFGAELRLRFGLRLDMVVTGAAIWAFWYWCVRPRTAIG